MALGFGKRIKQAILDRASQIGRAYTGRELAHETGLAERGRGKPYAASMVTEWIAERSQPGLAAFHAMAKVTGKDVAWLMAIDLFSSLPAEPTPAETRTPKKRLVERDELRARIAKEREKESTPRKRRNSR